MKKSELAKIGMEFFENYYTKYKLSKEVQYIYRGQVKTRREYYLTEEGKRINELLKVPAFTCPHCGRLVSFNQLECWTADSIEDFENDEVTCSSCYEDEMGEDL